MSTPNPAKLALVPAQPKPARPVCVNLYRLGSHSLISYHLYTTQKLHLGGVVKVKDQAFQVKGFGFEPTGLAIHLGAL